MCKEIVEDFVKKRGLFKKRQPQERKIDEEEFVSIFDPFY